MVIKVNRLTLTTQAGSTSLVSITLVFVRLCCRYVGWFHTPSWRKNVQNLPYSVKRLELFPRLGAEEPLTQLGGLSITQGDKWQCGQAFGPSSTGGSYPLGSIKISYHYANILVGMTNTTKVLADINLAVQYWNAIHVQCHNIGGYKDGLPNCQI